jgi:aquaporin related protein
VVTRQFHSYHWIYWVGPILGSLLASGFYKFIKMLEYETANPGQDRSKTAGEHFNPDEHTEKARVSFAPEEYAMEEGRVMRSDGGVMEPDGTGDPHEYGRQQRPYSKSPAPPHANDQYAGLDGGMHSDDQQPRYYPHNSIGADSDRTVVVPTANSSLPTANPSTHANVQDGFERNPVVGTNGRNKGVQSTPKSGTLRKTPSPATPPRSSGNLKSNTYYNRNIGSGPGEGPDDEEFYDKN